VVDASVAAAWLLPEIWSEAAEGIFADLADDSPVPALFWSEMRNVLLVAERRGRIAPGEALAALRRLRRLPLEDTGNAQDLAVLTFASRHGLTAYDATYLAVAFERGLPLATFDKSLASGARAEGIPIIGPLANG
jgi:predicted nucleic acid-binding protein